MAHELIALSLVAFIHVWLVFWSQSLLTRDIGREGNASPRDGELDLKPDTLRLRRALANHTENIGLFVSAVVIVLLSDSASTFTAICAYSYVAARLLYVPAYFFGWAPWRSLIFTVGLLATLAMIVAALF